MASFYVDFVSGSDAAAGTTQEAPKKTSNSAATAASDGDTIYFHPGQTHTSGFFSTGKNLTFRVWPGKGSGHILFSGSSTSALCTVSSGADSFAIYGTIGSEFRFTNTSTTDGTGPVALHFNQCPSTTADSYILHHCRFLDTPRTGFRFSRPGGLTMRWCHASDCGNGFSFTNSQGEGQDYGRNITVEDCDAFDMRYMVRHSGTGASSDYGGVGFLLERVAGGEGMESWITFRRCRAVRCYAVRNGAEPENFDGAGWEWFASRNILLDDCTSVDNKNVWESGTQEFGTVSSAHAQETTLGGAIVAGAVSFTTATVKTGVGWRLGDCVYVDTEGTSEEVILDDNGGTTTRTCHLAGTVASGFANNHSSGVRVSPAMPNEGKIVSLKAWATSPRVTLDGVSTDGHIRGALMLGMSRTDVSHSTFRDFDQFALSIPTPVGNDFPGSSYGSQIRDCIFYSVGGTDGDATNPQTRRCVQVADAGITTDILDRNTYYNEAAGGVLLRWQGSDKTTWANVQATGVEKTGSNTDPGFVAAASVRLGAASTMIGIGGSMPGNITSRPKHGARYDRGGAEWYYAEDTFDRTQVDGLGTADSGETWDTNDGSLTANWDADASLATVNQVTTATNRAGFDDTIADAEMTYDWSYSSTPGGTTRTYATFHLADAAAGDVTNELMRVETAITNTSTVFRTGAWLDSAGTANTFTNGASTQITRETFVPDEWFRTRARFRQDGTAETATSEVLVETKHWRLSTDEPSDWDMQARSIGSTTYGDGGVGLRTNASAGAGTLTVRFNDMLVRALDPSMTPLERRLRL